MTSIPLGYLGYPAAVETYRLNCPGLMALPPVSSDERRELANLELAANWLLRRKLPPLKSLPRLLLACSTLKTEDGRERYKKLFHQRWNVAEGKKCAAKMLDAVLTATIPSAPNLTVGLPSVFLDFDGKIYSIGPDFWRSVAATDSRNGKSVHFRIEGEWREGWPLVREGDVIHCAKSPDNGITLPKHLSGPEMPQAYIDSPPPVIVKKLGRPKIRDIAADKIKALGLTKSALKELGPQAVYKKLPKDFKVSYPTVCRAHADVLADAEVPE